MSAIACTSRRRSPSVFACGSRRGTTLFRAAIRSTHAIWALATGGSFGTGLGLGDTRYLPAGHTDLILAAIGEELGAAGLLLVAALYALLAWRGFRIGRLARNDYGFFLATR